MSSYPRVEVVDAVEAHVEPIALRMRISDRLELDRLGRHDPYKVLYDVVRDESAITRTILADGKPEAMGGVTDGSDEHISGAGVVWVLGTYWLDRHPIALLKIVKAELPKLTLGYEVVGNAIDHDNKSGARWLERAGFHLVEEPIPLGPHDELFTPFWRLCDV